jgi:MoaA/NifB/PqqE/SkfB family radical SAM enzyme
MSVRMLAFHLTDRCNLNCQHCLRDPVLQPTDVPLALVEKVLDQARSVYGLELVALTGGEPFLHPDIVAILDAIVDRGMKWHAVSNGSRLPLLARALEERPSRREGLARLYFSLDGAEERTHDTIRGAGSFREVMRAISLCTAWGVPFVLQMALNAKNVGEIEAFAVQAAELGAERASFSWLQPTGTHLDAELALPRAEWKRALERIRRVAAVVRMPVGTPEGFPSPHAFHVCDPWQSHTLHVDVQGNLSLCCQQSGIPGRGERTDVLADLRDTSLVEGHRRMLGLVHELEQERLAQLEAGTLTGWDEFPCNWCLKQFGKPHWTDDGRDGAEAGRARWRGVWAGGATGRPLVTRDDRARVRLAIVEPDAE